MVTIPPVRCFDGSEADKPHALKPLEEAAEVFAAWQELDYLCESGVDAKLPAADFVETLEIHRQRIIEECADVIQAVCNLLSALGVDDMTDAMAACEQRNLERGRYGD